MSSDSRPRIPTAVGLAAGAEGRDVETLQGYLRRFGYMSANGHDAATALEPPTGRYDEATTEAVRAYQRFHGLPPTGTLDDATVVQMGAPRCGRPDVQDAAGLSSFTAQGNRWTTNHVRYGFQNFCADLTEAEVRTAFAAACGLWSEVTPLTFIEVPVSENPEIVIRFVADDHGDGSAFDGPGFVLAHAFFPPPNGGAIAGDAHFDEAETWSVTVPVPTDAVDLVTVAAHELGHSLGLAHSTVESALMNPTYSGPHRFLDPDDRAGIQSIYGPHVGPWEELGGVLTSAPDVCSWAAGRLDVFARGQDNTLCHLPYQGDWGSWESLGGFLTSNPSAVSWGPGRIDVFARGQGNVLLHKWYDGGWSDWESLGGVLTSGPDACSWGSGRLDVFARGADFRLYHKSYDGGWSDWEGFEGVIGSDPSAVSWGPGRIDVFASGAGNALRHKWYDGGWSGWETLGGVITSGPDACSWAPGRLDVFARGQGLALCHLPFEGGWGSWESFGGIHTSDPGAESWGPGRIDVFTRGLTNGLEHKWYDGNWKP